MSLNGALIFLTPYWLFLYIAILQAFFETYSQYFHSNIIFALKHGNIVFTQYFLQLLDATP